MSRIGKKPITIPGGVTVSVDKHVVSVSGPKGSLTQKIHPRMKIAVEGSTVSVTRPTDEPQDRALHGLSRTLVANMVDGVTKGFEKKLEIQGVGYRGQMKGAVLTLNLGFSHPIDVNPPAGVILGLNENIISVSGPDKVKVGEVAAHIRSLRPPEPYKGKGVRYLGEVVRRKEGKKAASA